MVGGAVACALGLQGFAVALIEPRAPQRSWPEGQTDLRVSALSRASQRILQNLGAWSRMVELGVSPYRDMRVWDATGGGSIHFSSAEIGEPDLGHIVENRVTRLALWELLEGLEKVRILCPASVQALRCERRRVGLSLADGAQVEAGLVVGADGSTSAIRSLADIATRGWAYDQHAVVANVRTERSHRETARQRFMPSGPLAFLPLRDDRCSIVWSTSPRHAAELLALDEPAFCAALTQASGGILGAVLETGPRAGFPLTLRHAERYVRPGVALVGDAAHVVHPLAGQGVNIGLLDAATLAQVLVEGRPSGREPGSLAVLRRYERARKGGNLGVLALMDTFKRLFGSDLGGVRLVRNLGLDLTDRLTPLKRMLVRHAMGTSGELPALARALPGPPWGP